MQPRSAESQHIGEANAAVTQFFCSAVAVGSGGQYILINTACTAWPILRVRCRISRDGDSRPRDKARRARAGAHSNVGIDQNNFVLLLHIKFANACKVQL